MTDMHALYEKLSQITEEWTGRSWDGTQEHIDQALEAQRWCVDALEAHGEWLHQMRRRALSAGCDWTTAECRRRSRLDGDLTTPPEWLAQAAERGAA